MRTQNDNQKNKNLNSKTGCESITSKSSRTWIPALLATAIPLRSQQVTDYLST